MREDMKELDDADYLEMAKELDGMDRDVTSWESGFLDSVLRAFKRKNELTHKQKMKLKDMYNHYINGSEAEGDE